ncbi:MAG: methyltransferase domain-containing protein [Rhodanobacteraceae bacterium]|nr:methyltransferase domain-containing protein [Rhodanobacteraceae bacterium]
MDTLKWWIFPGVNLHARERFRIVPLHFRGGEGRSQTMLDAGFGNGMLSLQAWRRGYRVIGVSLKESEVRGARRLFNEKLGISEGEICFLDHNLYDTDGLKRRYGEFDEIVCADVIEHIVDDRGICAAFYSLLKPGGYLHLTTPNADHPYNANFPLDLEEKGGHVRAGYNEAAFRDLLGPIGFQVEAPFGFGGAIRQWFNSRTKALQERFGPWAGVPCFLVALPLLPLDSRSPAVPFSYYVQARKPAE